MDHGEKDMNGYREAVQEARELARSHLNGLLSTLSAEMGGWPFGSVAPYVLDYAGDALLLLSDLAQHSHNLKRDDRMSLLVWDDSGTDIQQGGRVTLLGRACVVEGDAAMRTRYRRYVPKADDYFRIHDFRFYRLQVERVRYIGGFGNIHWIRGEDYRYSGDAAALWDAEESAVQHMNQDHVEALSLYCRSAGIEDPAPRLLGIDPEGFDVEAAGRRLRLRFSAPVHDAASLRAEFTRTVRTLREGAAGNL
ncbi:MAG: HugZ family pyridoxamine 5'-phosphate oxidase [Acidiferrobacteraceae bacterium]